MRKLIIKVYAVVLSLGVLYYVIGAVTGRYLPCLFHQTTGLLCPTCGITRMFLALFRGEITAAFTYHPVMFALLILWNTVAVLGFLGRIRNKKFVYVLLSASIVALTGFGVLRNLI